MRTWSARRGADVVGRPGTRADRRPRLVGSAAASFLVAAVGAAAYRWYVAETVPRGLTTLLGTAVVAVYLNTVGLFASVIPVGGAVAADPFDPVVVVRNVISLVVAAGAATPGRDAGDRFAVGVTAVTGADAVDGAISRFARTIGRIRSLTPPEEIADLDGYDPADDATKERLAGETLLFPRRLSEAALREEFVGRLKAEYDVGQVDAEFDGDRVTHLGVGKRVAGIGPTLGPERVATAELRATVGGATLLPAGRGRWYMNWKLFADLAEAAGESEPDVDAAGAATVGDALDALLESHPALAARVLDEDGDLRAHINLLHNGRDVREGEGLETPVDDDDELALFPPVSGG